MNNDPMDTVWDLLEMFGFDRNDTSRRITEVDIEIRPFEFPVLKVKELVNIRHKTTKFRIEKI